MAKRFKCLALMVMVVVLLGMVPLSCAPKPPATAPSPPSTSTSEATAEATAEPTEPTAPTTTVAPPGVSVTLDTGINLTLYNERSVGRMATANGATLETGDAEGNHFHLQLPPNAVLEPEDVSLTPVSAIDGLPLEGEILAAVKLEPEGLQLLELGTLTIELPSPVTTGCLVGFGFDGNGEGLHLIPIEVNGTTLTFKTTHFSFLGAAVMEEVFADCATAFGNLPPAERAKHQIGCVDAAFELYGESEEDREGAIVAIGAILRVWAQESVLPKLNAADTWETLENAIGEYSEWVHYYKLVLVASVLVPELDAAADDLLKALEEAIERVRSKENGLYVCAGGEENRKALMNRLLYLEKRLDLIGGEDVWTSDVVCTVGIDVKAVIPGTDEEIPEPSVNPGETSEGAFQLVATVTDPSGVAYNASELPCVSVIWESDDEDIATVDQDGVVTGVNSGTVAIAATITGLDDAYIHKETDEVIVEVGCTIGSISVSPEYWELPIGETLQLSLEVRDTEGNLLEDYDACWGSSDDNLATVDTSGLVTGVAEGWVNVGAKVCGEWGLATIIVIDPTISISIIPDYLELEVGKNRQLLLSVRGAVNFPQGYDIAWSSSDDNIASVDADGLVTGVAEGTATITATIDGQSMSATIKVIPASPEWEPPWYDGTYTGIIKAMRPVNSEVIVSEVTVVLMRDPNEPDDNLFGYTFTIEGTYCLRCWSDKGGGDLIICVYISGSGEVVENYRLVATGGTIEIEEIFVDGSSEPDISTVPFEFGEAYATGGWSITGGPKGSGPHGLLGVFGFYTSLVED